MEWNQEENVVIVGSVGSVGSESWYLILKGQGSELGRSREVCYLPDYNTIFN